MRHRRAKENGKHKPTRCDVRASASKEKGRSAITNGAYLLPKITDRRSTWYRRFRDVRALHLSDLGGEANCSHAEQSLVRRAAALTTELERLELKFASSADQADPKDLELYQRGMNTLRRVLESLGLQRRARDVTPTLSEYLAGKAEADAA
jgi:hypothetical protein